MRRRAGDALVAQGLHEVVGWSFNGPELRDKLRLAPEELEVELENPMSSEQSRMRTTLLGSLLDIAARNRAHGAGALRLFEAGAVFLAAGRAAALGAPPSRWRDRGRSVPASWRDADPPDADFFTAKGVVAALLAALGSSFESSARPTRSCIRVAGGDRDRRARRRLAGRGSSAGRRRVGPRRDGRGLRARSRRGAGTGDQALRGPRHVPSHSRGSCGDRLRGGERRPGA